MIAFKFLRVQHALAIIAIKTDPTVHVHRIYTEMSLFNISYAVCYHVRILTRTDCQNVYTSVNVPAGETGLLVKI